MQREVFSIVSVLGLIMRRLASKLLSSVLCKTKLVHCKEYSSQGFSVELILILSKEIGHSSHSMTFKTNREQ